MKPTTAELSILCNRRAAAGLIPAVCCLLLLGVDAVCAAENSPVRRLTDYLPAGAAVPGTDDPARDDTALLKKALSAGPGTVQLGPGTFRCCELTVPDNVQLVGAGTGTVIMSIDRRPIFVQKNVHDWAIRDLVLEGGEIGHWHLRNDEEATGLRIAGCWSYEVSGITVRNFDGAALEITRTNLVESAFSNGGKLDRITATGNYTGIRFGIRGEYVTATHLNCSRNIVGCLIEAGNTNISTSNFCGNTDGLVLTDKENGSHGTINGCLINHNERYALRARDVDNGMSISGCCFYYGAIELLNSRGINLVDSQINCHVTVRGQFRNRLAGNYVVPAHYTFRIGPETLVQDNFTRTGSWQPAVSPSALEGEPADLRRTR